MKMVRAISPPHIDYPEDGSVRPVKRLVWYPVETTPLPPPAPDKLAGRRIVLAGGREETAGRIAATLREYGATVYRYLPEQADPVQAAVAFKARVQAIDGIVDLNVEEPFSLERGRAWEEPLRQSLALLKACYEEWAGETEATRVFYLPITRMDGVMGHGEDAAVQPLGGIWAGLAKTLPTEIPNCNVRVLDLSCEDWTQIDQLVARELYEWGLFEVGYRRGVRYTLAARTEEVGEAALSLDAADTVVMSGGARGIGFALARELARNFGCRVVLTGRTPLPTGEEPWLSLDEPSFKAYQRGLLTSPPPGKTVAAVRRDVEAIKRRRDLHAHLRAVVAEGLPIEYRVCDVTSPDAVRALFAALGPGVSGVIHNAGIDAPVRLPAKSVEACIGIVGIKVNGFLHLVEALEGRPLKFFCNVGSLTGRLGGMTGETDYAAANEGLARLGLWAAGERQWPVKTLCWPTWEKLGMIANFDVTLRYMSAVNVKEAVHLWQRELLDTGRGEVTFMGPAGSALSPVQLRGYPPTSELPGVERLYGQYHYLGEVSAFRPWHSIQSRAAIDPSRAPCMYDFDLGGAAALPISVLLEYALALGDWILPDGRAELKLHEVRDLVVYLSALRVEDRLYSLEKVGRGHWSDGRWIVDVTLTQPTTVVPQTVARLHLVYAAGTPPSETVALEHAGPIAEAPAPVPGFSWAGTIFKRARWAQGTGGTLIGEVPPCHPADLWVLPSPPPCRLPATHLENIFRASMSGRQLDGPPARLMASTMGMLSGGAAPRSIVGSVAEGRWYVVDGKGRGILRLEGVAWR